MSTPKQDLLAALKGAIRDLPEFSRVVREHTLGKVMVRAETDTGAVVATCVIAQRLVPTKGAQLALEDAVKPVAVATDAPAAPASEAASSVAPADDSERVNGLAIGDIISVRSKSGVAWIEVMGVDEEGFCWRTTKEKNPRDRDEGDTLWSEIEHIEGKAWREIAPKKAEPPAHHAMGDIDRVAFERELNTPTPAAEVVAPVEGFVIEAAPLDELTEAAAPMIAQALGQVQRRELRPVVEIRAEIEAEEVAKEAGSLRHRALILRDSGDWSRCRKGLAAWDAMKTSGAGTQSGGSCAPLVMIHTPAVGSPDVEKLLGRLAKENRKFLDLGEVDRTVLYDHAPSNREIRKRWNAAHPEAVVDVSQWAPSDATPAVVPSAPVSPVKPTKKARGAKSAGVTT